MGKRDPVHGPAERMRWVHGIEVVVLLEVDEPESRGLI
jgi:hypothetical protein